MSIDAGTTGITTMLVDHSGSISKKAYREFPQHFPQPGWVEHYPAEMWDAVLSATGEILEGIAGSAVAAIGITNQRETAVLWERSTGKEVFPAIVWQCRRSAPICDELRASGLEPRARELTGLVLDAYFSATKLTWLFREIDGLRARATAGELAFGTIDSWLISQMTGGAVHATDYSNASRTLLFDIHKRSWSSELLESFEVPPEVLPTVLPSSHRFGTTNPKMFHGLEVPIAGVAGDQQSALFGQACFSPGMSKNTYGTGSFVLTNTGASSPVSSHGLLTSIAWGIEDKVDYALEGSIFATGAAVQWLRDGLGLIEAAGETGPLAESIDSTDGVYLVPAFVGLGAPHWDPYARGILTGITRGTTKAHVARAALEAMAYQTRDVVEAMTSDSGVEIEELRVDGGASANDFLCQFQSDLLQTVVSRPKIQETTAMGAAYMAGISTGFWSGTDEVAGHWKLERAFEPRMDQALREELYAGWKVAVGRARS
ncbi:MAG TPA: glycerol kinase GlpK [Actinomycetota bacterium]|nr:glycerol kinase GlpK [Actinomycetota bacterium]